MAAVDDFTEQNRKTFDDLAMSYDAKDWQKKLIEQIAEQIRRRLDWLEVEWADEKKGKEVKLLDYACGNGLVSRALGPSVTHILGIDLSANMVTAYNDRAASLTSSSVRPSNLRSVRAIEGNVLDPDSWSRLSADLPSLCASTYTEGAMEKAGFDVAVACMGVHHFADPALAIARLAQLVKPQTGVVLVLDLVKVVGDADSAEARRIADGMGGAGHTIHPQHNGFRREEVEEMFRAARLEGFKWDTCPTQLLFGEGKNVERTAFLARGVRMGEVNDHI
ncbi:MAG: hypothetical protein M1822_005333 [Bathelium mastoideum]|nr:MAG: hypothetical protein M1822_005333 [Bathelium mastoideum]